MDTYAADVAELTAHLDLKMPYTLDTSTGGGEVIRYAAKIRQRQGSQSGFDQCHYTIYDCWDERNPDGVPLAVLMTSVTIRYQQSSEVFTKTLLFRF